MATFLVIVISMIIGISYASSSCRYYNGDPFMFAVAINNCIQVDDDTNGMKSESLSCIMIDNKQYIQHKTFQDSMDCTQSDDNLISTRNIECTTTDCNCDYDQSESSSDSKCDTAIFTNYEQDNDGNCDYNQYQKKEIIVNECITFNTQNNTNSYNVNCDETDGLIYTLYSKSNCVGDIIESDYALHSKSNNCFDIQCPENVDDEDQIQIFGDLGNVNDDDDEKDILRQSQNDPETTEAAGHVIEYGFGVLIGVIMIIIC